MGLEGLPLLAHNPQLTTAQKNNISLRIQRRSVGVKILSVVLVFSCLAGPLSYFITSITSGYRGIYSVPIVLFATCIMLSVGTALGLWKLAGRQSQVGAHLFGSLYIGSWVYHPDDWTYMASQRYRRALKVGSIMVLIFAFLCALGAIIMCKPSFENTLNLFDTQTDYMDITATRSHKMDDVWILYGSVSGGAILILALLSIFIPLISRNARFNAEVHSCVLARGAIFYEGQLHSLSPWYSGFFSQRLKKVVLSRKNIRGKDMDILTVSMGLFNRTIEIPVNENMLHHVVMWAQTFQQRHSSTPIDIINPLYAQKALRTGYNPHYTA
ncbi:hypothetical protein PROFUN_03026 [Planoprotostelium fungivorum]|uniref:Uncharacterized protein n=1 Tax=Planoprotostelium fungivorum TaxID=1890364 RepID=A0A2P6NXC4_9EUKA|nr:hypothetical protein PROFUN_03026 [Planoprotostelium fungivorum]